MILGLFTGLLSNSVASWVGQSYDLEHIARIKGLLPSDGHTEGRKGKESE